MLFCWLGVSSRAYGVTVRNRGLRGTRMGRPFLLSGLRARVSSWPPLRLVRLRCERVSVGVVPSQRFPLSIKEGSRGSGALYRDGCASRVRPARGGRGSAWSEIEGRIGVTPEALRRGLLSFAADDQVALEATGNSDAIANLLTPIVAGWWCRTRRRRGRSRRRRCKTDKVDARILGAAAGGGLSAAGVAAGRADPGAAPAGHPAALSLVRQRTRIKNQVHAILARNLRPDSAGVGPVRQDGPALAVDANRCRADERSSGAACCAQLDFHGASSAVVDKELAVEALIRSRWWPG